MKIEENADLSKFLENGLRMLYDENVKSVAILATTEDDDISIGYYHCSVSTKLMYAGYIQQDAMIDTLKTNNLITDTSEDIESFSDDVDPTE